MKIKRIKPPKFRVGRYVLNEYELRQLFIDHFNQPFTFKDLQTGVIHTYNDYITPQCESTSLIGSLNLELIRLKRAESC